MSDDVRARDEAWADYIRPGQYVSTREADAWRCAWDAALAYLAARPAVDVERIRASFRLAVESGDLTPMGGRVLNHVLDAALTPDVTR